MKDHRKIAKNTDYVITHDLKLILSEDKLTMLAWE